MGLRLLLLGLWTPKYVIRRELDDISNQTTAALKALIPEGAIKEDDTQNTQPPRSIQQQRANMARTHEKLVETLEAAVGHEEAVKRGREALFSVGLKVGKQARSRLGVGGNPKDLIKAAKILYRVLGINFTLQWVDHSNAEATINRCALSEQYSKFACEVLSATDEGVITGLQENVKMKFKQYMTSGCKVCKADIHIDEKETRQ